VGRSPGRFVHSRDHRLLLADILPFVMMRRVAAVVCVAALAGCSSDAEPEPLPPVASASPSPAAALPVPPEATPETAPGAAAFARYYLELLNVAFRTSDATAVKAVSTQECEGCQNLIAAIERGDEPGETVTGGDYSVVFAEAPPVENGDVIVELRYDVSEVQVRQDGGDVSTLPAKTAIDAQMRLLRRGDIWMVQGFRNLSS
jgi:hypothetical protein